MSLAVVVLAAGKGTRMRSEVPKVLHELCGRSMLAWVLNAAAALEPERLVVVLGHGREEVEKHLGGLSIAGLPRAVCAQQEPQLGTGHAVKVTRDALAGFEGQVLVLYGDTPLLTGETLRQLVAKKPEGGTSILTARPEDPTGLGRILRDDSGAVQSIVEQKDATPDQRAIREINSGMYVFDAEKLFPYLDLLGNDNQQGEYYLTDLISMYVRDGLPVVTHECEDPRETSGVNSLLELASARSALQMRILERHLAAGVRIQDPATAYVDADVEIGRGTVIMPCTVIQKGVRVGENCVLGPFANLRPKTVLADGVEVGNFVEVNRSSMATGAKAKHLTYLGDTVVGEKANIGAGTVTANYDGKNKHRTEIKKGAFIGSGSILVAPCTIGEGAKVGANAALVRGDIPAGSVYVGVPAKPIEERKQASETVSGEGD